MKGGRSVKFEDNLSRLEPHEYPIWRGRSRPDQRTREQHQRLADGAGADGRQRLEHTEAHSGVDAPP